MGATIFSNVVLLLDNINDDPGVFEDCLWGSQS
jgi:hypothetical protein